jgi:hypothetical protein
VLVPGAVLVLALVGLGMHARMFQPFLCDDALISLRYASRLLHGRGLTWTDGAPVEGYSNLLWVLLCALLGRGGVDLIVTARLLGIAFMALAVAAPVWAYRTGSVERIMPAFVGAMGVALSTPVAVWTLGGLEPPLVAALLAWAVVVSYRLLDAPDIPWRAALLPGLLLGLLCIARLDGVLFTLAFCLWSVLMGGPWRLRIRRVARLGTLPALFCAVQILFRRLYYGTWVPNTAYVKLTPTLHRVHDGLVYLSTGTWFCTALFLMAGVGALLARSDGRFRRRALLIAIALASWALYVVAIGGDIFAGHRHMVPAVVLLSLLAAEAMESITTGSAPRIRRLAEAGALVACLLLPAGGYLATLLEVRFDHWVWDGQVVGLFLKQAFASQRPLVAVDPAGCIPYWSGLPAIDMLGLNDAHIARHPSRERGRGILAHELGDGAYVLARKPDILVFNGPCGGELDVFPSGKELAASAAFRARYQLVPFLGEQPYSFLSLLWVRREGGRVGIVRGADRIDIPGYLASQAPDCRVRLDGRGRCGTSATAGSPAVLSGLHVDSGDWRLVVRSTADEFGIRVRADGKTLSGQAHTGPGSSEYAFVFRHRHAGPVTLEIAPAAGRECLVTGIALRRQPLHRERGATATGIGSAIRAEGARRAFAGSERGRIGTGWLRDGRADRPEGTSMRFEGCGGRSANGDDRA